MINIIKVVYFIAFNAGALETHNEVRRVSIFILI